MRPAMQTLHITQDLEEVRICHDYVIVPARLVSLNHVAAVPAAT